MKPFQPVTDDSPSMIILGVLFFYVLIIGFAYYFYFMGKISTLALLIIVLIFTAAYIPRFLVVYKVIKKDEIKIEDDAMVINGKKYKFIDISDFRIIKHKPVVVFFISNRAIVYNQTDFVLKLKTPSNEIKFTVINSEKANLLTEYLRNVISQ